MSYGCLPGIPLPNEWPIELREVVVGTIRSWDLPQDVTPNWHLFRQLGRSIVNRCDHEAHLSLTLLMIRVNDGAARASHETCLRRTSDPVRGYAQFSQDADIVDLHVVQSGSRVG
jgi:hypothetical protein